MVWKFNSPINHGLGLTRSIRQIGLPVFETSNFNLNVEFSLNRKQCDKTNITICLLEQP